MLGLLALMASGPFLYPVHSFPITSFWSEWWAAAFGLAAAIAGFLLVRFPFVLLPRAAWILGIPLASIAIHLLAGQQTFPAIALLQAAGLLWALLLLVLGRHLAATLELSLIADVLAGALTLGAALGAGIALAQWLGVAASVPGMFFLSDAKVYGNIGQANHHAHYSWLGIASAFHLRGRNRLSRPAFWSTVVLTAFGSLLGGSRSIFLYALMLASLFAWAAWRAPAPAMRGLRNTALLLLPIVVALSLLSSWMSPPLADYRMPGTTSVERLFTQISGPSIRLALAHTAWQAFLDAPWLGHGPGGFPWAAFQVAAPSAGAESLQVAEHAHNFILDGLVEYGAVAMAGTLALLGLWLRGFVRQAWGLPHIWCAAILGIGLIHAMLEYPYWYTYFLGPAALLLGAFDTGPARRVAGRRFQFYLLIFSIAGAATLFNLRRDYLDIETITYRPLSLHQDREQSWRMAMDRLLRVHHGSLLSPWTLLALATMADPSSQQAGERVTVCRQAIRLAPARSLLTRCAMQYAIAGQPADGARLLAATLRAFPMERQQTIRELEQWLPTHQEIAPLLALAHAR